MKEHLKKLARITLIAIFWVFLFSIQIGNHNIFYYANDLFVQNKVVRAIDAELGDIWSRLTRTARVTFSEMTKEDKKG